jgi:tRNA(Ile)-lysidine synthase
VWLRREVLPRLESGAARDLVPVLARQADVLREEAAVLDAAVADVAVAGSPLDAARVAALPLGLARRAVRRWLAAERAGGTDVDAVLAVARGDARAVELAGGVRVERAANRLTLARPGRSRPVAATVHLPGHAGHGSVRVDAWIETAPPVAWPDGRTTCVVDADAVGGVAVLRPAEAGERFRPLGSGGTKTVFDALAERGVGASQRPHRLVLAAPDTPASGGVGGPGTALPAGAPWWVLGYRVDDRARVTARTRRYLWIAVTGTDAVDVVDAIDETAADEPTT